MKQTHLDLFSGIGGFALAAKWAGFETVQFVEYEPYAQKVLAKNFPGIPIHGDIYEFDATEYLGVTLITGGFPCQPFSHAGKRLGTADDRAIWPQMLRVIQEARPTWVLGENVSGLIQMELDTVLFDLENEGYAAQSFVLPAVAKDARHRRDRVFIVAHSNNDPNGTNGRQEGKKEVLPGINWEERQLGLFGGTGGDSGNVAHPESSGNKRESRNMAEKDGSKDKRRKKTSIKKPLNVSQNVAHSNCNEYERNSGALGGAQAGEEKTEYKPSTVAGSGSKAGTEENVPDTNGIRCNRRKYAVGIRETDDTGADCAERRKGKDVADSTGIRQPGQGESGAGIYPEEKGKGQTAGPVNCGGQDFGSSQSKLGRVVDGIPNWMDRHLTWEPEPDIPKVINGLKSRSLRLKGLGNAIVPQVAFEIIRCMKS